MSDLEAAMSEDLASVLDSDKMIEGQNNQRMRDFFQKLIQTDAQIRKLKQSISNSYQIDNLKTITDRYKRSINKIKRKRRARSKDNNETTTKKITSKSSKESSKKDNKRSVTLNDLGLTGYVIESKEIVIKYDTDKKRNFPKCSHTQEEPKSHEKQLKHPFYKHSQRLDEMLNTYQKPEEKIKDFNIISGDNIIDDIWNTTNSNIYTKTEADQTIIESITKVNKIKPYDYKSRLQYRENIQNHESNYDDSEVYKGRSFVKTTDDYGITKKYNDKNSVKENILGNYEKRNDLDNGLSNDYEEKEQYRRFGSKNSRDKTDDVHHHHHTTASSTTMKEIDTSNDFDYKMEMFASSAPLYDVAISVSTLINPMDKGILKQKLPRKPYIGQRSLLQADEEDVDQEELGYEDLKEVLADEKEGHNDMDGHERKKRENMEQIVVPEEFNQNRHNPPKVFNQNWKGPMPLYPEEINAMIRHAAIQNMQIPVNSKDTKQERDIDKSDLSDTQYIQDYSDNNYNKMARMAQAYSDYGVLYDKKESVSGNDRGIKSPYMSKFNSFFNKHKLFEKSEKSNKGTISKRISTCPTAVKASEGFKFELKKGTPSNSADFRKDLEKYIKVIGNSHGCHTTTFGRISPVDYEFHKPLTPKLLLDGTTHASNTVSDSNDTPNRYIVVTFKKGSRSLKSIDLTYEDSNTVDEAIELNMNEGNNTINQEPNFNMTGEENYLIHHANVFDVYDVLKESTSQKTNDFYYVNSENNNFFDTTNNYNDIIKNVSSSILNDANNEINGASPLQITNNLARNYNKTRNLLNRKGLRTRKSTNMIDEEVNNERNENSKRSISKRYVNNSFNNVDNIVNVPSPLKSEPIANKTNSTTDGVISFISLMSDWFQTLANLSGEMKNEEFKGELQGNKEFSPNVTTPVKKKYLEENITKDILYPAYDVEMVDNIGHRSRVLMAVDDSSTEQGGLETRKSVLKTKSDLQKSTKDDSVINDIVPVALILATNATKEAKPISDGNKHNKAKNKTFVKRSLGGNLVFWNDLYDDDEYGIKLDYNDNIRDKHSAKKVRNILNKSRDWLQHKFDNVTNDFKGKWKNRYGNSKTNKKISTKLLSNEPVIILKERRVRQSNDNDNIDTKKSFSALTANMKNVFREAAKAIQDTRNIEVRENNKENAAATSLMQQLVRMMADLVDIQVQQKTCAKLPSDLYNFLEWLTTPADDATVMEDWATTPYDYDEQIRFVKSTEPNEEYPIKFTEDSHQDERTECLGTIRAVQDLIQQYDGMSDEDKSKMTGVREYLENQLLFLSNKVNKFNDPDLFKMYEKRELRRKRRHIDTSALKRREEKQKGEEDVNTISTYDMKTKNTVGFTESTANEKSLKKKVKRNWRDVYFKAVEDSKKTSTIKDSNKRL